MVPSSQVRLPLSTLLYIAVSHRHFRGLLHPHTMSASPDISGVPPEFVLRPIATVFPIEDRDHNLSSLIHGEQYGVNECRTPTSEESKIPPVPSSCPPAPKKPRRVLLCKRRLSELELFSAQLEEIELWFRQRDRPTTVPSLSCRSKKRKRRCLRKK